MAEAIKTLRVRGAPTIGVAAAYGIAIGALGIKTAKKDEFLRQLENIIEEIRGTRHRPQPVYGCGIDGSGN